MVTLRHARKFATTAALLLFAHDGAAITSAEIDKVVPRITFQPTFLPSDAMFVYSPMNSWWSNITFETTDHQQTTQMVANTTGANMTFGFYGTDIYIWGYWELGTTYTLYVDGEEKKYAAEVGSRMMAYTMGDMTYGYHTASLVLNRGSISIIGTDIRQYAFMKDVPKDQITGSNMLKGGADYIPKTAQMTVQSSGQLNSFFTSSGDSTIGMITGNSSESNEYEAPYWSGSSGATLAFDVPSGTTYLSLNGTPSETAAAFSITIDPLPIDDGPVKTTLSVLRAWKYSMKYIGGIRYYQLPLDPQQNYTVTIGSEEGNIGVYGVVFYSSQWDPNWNPADEPRPGTSSNNSPAVIDEGNGATGSNNGQTGSNGGLNGEGSNGGSNGETNSDGKSSTPIGAIVGGVVGGVIALLAIGFGIWVWRKKSAQAKRDSKFLIDRDPDPKISPFRYDPGPQHELKAAPHDDRLSEVVPAPAPLMRKRLDVLTVRNQAPDDALTLDSPHSSLGGAPNPHAHNRTSPESTPTTIATPLLPLRVEPFAPRSHPSPVHMSPTAPAHRFRATPLTAPAEMSRRPWGHPQTPTPEVENDVDVGRIVALVPPQYNPAWRNGPEHEPEPESHTLSNSRLQDAFARVAGREEHATL